MPKVTRHASSNSAGTTGFTNPGNAYASDDSYATAAPGTNSTISSYFGGFDFASYIPSGSQIHSVVVGIERKMSTTASTASTTGRAYDNTTTIGNEATSTAEPTSDTVWTFSPSTLPTITQIRSSTFRILVGAKRGAGSTGYTFSLDDVYVTVDYTAPPAAPIVQVKRAITNGINSTTLSFDTLPTVGNTIIVIPASYAGNLATGAVTDNQSHTYTRRALIEADSGTDNGDLCQYHTTVVNSSGTFTITLNPDGSSADVTWLVFEVSGRAASPYDTYASAQASGTSTSASTGNITPSENNCLLVAAVSHTGSDTTITETLSGCTLIDEIEGGTNYMPLSVVVKLQTTAASEAATWTLGSSVEWICCVVSYKAAASGTTYNQSVSGAVTSSGEVVKSARKPLAGAITPDGTVSRSTRKILSGALTSAGVVIKRTSKSQSGALEPSGVLSAIKTALISLAGSLEPAGDLIKSARKAVSGTITPAGDLIKSIQKILSGALTAAGELIAEKATGAIVYYQSIAGTLTSAGELVRKTITNISGAILPAGTVTKSTNKPISGALSTSGGLANSALKRVSGSINPTGDISKRTGKGISGAITPLGEIRKSIGKALAGALTFSKNLAVLAVTFILPGNRQAHKADTRPELMADSLGESLADTRPELMADDRDEIQADTRPEIKADKG